MKRLIINKLEFFENKSDLKTSCVKGALNTTNSDVKECGDHAGTRCFAVRCLVLELLISEDSNLSYRLTNHSAAGKQAAEKFERVPAGRAVIGQSIAQI